MQNQLNSLRANAQNSIADAKDLTSLEQLRVHYLGKKGELTNLLKSVSDSPVEQRPEMGKLVNELKRELQAMLDLRLIELEAQALEQKLNSQRIDISLPGRGKALGSTHPVTQVRQRLEALFKSIGFSVESGPEIENEYYNFEALNIPDNHPARAMHDTFYCGEGLLLRTHTSPSQIRVMEQQKPPIRIITPGRVYRRDSDHTHTPMFHQIEVLVVDEHCNFANLKAFVQDFLNSFFEKEVKLRFRPSYFPFTEPSAEIDIACVMCEGKGCRVCKETTWLEVLGCGMIHPKVLANVGIDSEKYSGYAMGMGIDRLAMLYYAIPDLRLLFENDLRFLRQF